MNKYILIFYPAFAAVLFLASPASAQQTKPASPTKTVAPPAKSASPAAAEQKPAAPASQISPEKRAEMITNSMIKNLALTSAQINKVRDINLQSVQQMEAARARHQKNPQAMVDEADLISRSRLSRLKDVLTHAQFQKYQRKREQEMGIPQAPGQAPGQPARSVESQSYDQ
jgi:hypothetical protein